MTKCQGVLIVQFLSPTQSKLSLGLQTWRWFKLIGAQARTLPTSLQSILSIKDTPPIPSSTFAPANLSWRNLKSPHLASTTMAEQSNISTKSGSQITRKPPNTVPNPLRKRNPRKHPRANGQTNHSNVDIHNSPYYKIRSLVQELRPHVVKV